MAMRSARLFLILFACLSACGGAATQASGAGNVPLSKKPLAEVDVAAFKAVRDNGTVTVIDVRTPQEFAEGHVPGAVNIPVDAIQSRLGELETHKAGDIYLICRSGARSARAQGVLAAAGFVNPINIAGGTLAWQAAGYPVE